jgi:hypothetical protein
VLGDDPGSLVRRFPVGPQSTRIAWYRLGDAHLAIRSDLADFHSRFASRFAECGCEEPTPDAPLRVEYALHASPDRAHVLVSVSGGSLAGLDFAFQLYALDGYGVTCAGDGWTLVTPAGARVPTLALSAKEVVASTRHPWRRFVANLAVNHVLSLQRDALFFHAAAVAIRGRGLMLFGPKGFGKTTLSLALAARGHAFNGDEIAGVDVRDLGLIPVPRAASVREGPGARAVQDALSQAVLPVERLPDGSVRRRVRVASLFPEATPARVPLSTIVVLGERKAAPVARLISPRWEEIGRFAPLGCSVWSGAPGARAMQLLNVLDRVTCFALDPGAPDDTARYLEELVESA